MVIITEKITELEYTVPTLKETVLQSCNRILQEIDGEVVDKLERR